MLSPLTAEQRGMVTATQARELGVSRLDLSRLVQDGTSSDSVSGHAATDGARSGPAPAATLAGVASGSKTG